MIENLIPPLVLCFIGCLITYIACKIGDIFEDRMLKTYTDFESYDGNFEMAIYSKNCGKKEKKILVLKSFELCIIKMPLIEYGAVYNYFKLNHWLCTKDKLVYWSCKRYNGEFLYDGQKVVITKKK